jgi:hypothetical protein
MENVSADGYRRRFMKNRRTGWGTLAGMTALMGMFPLLITMGITQIAPGFGALVLTIIHLALMGTGAWIFAIWFGD